MSTESITQKQFNFGKPESLKVNYFFEFSKFSFLPFFEKKIFMENFFTKRKLIKKQRVLNSSIVDSGSDTDSLIDSPLANRNGDFIYFFILTNQKKRNF